MTKEETAECIKVMQAYTNGEIIEEKRLSFDSTEWVESIDTSWQWYKFDYRIKPRPKYRPFKDADECWQEMQKHQPFGWVRGNSSSYYKHINNLYTNNISFQETEIAESSNFERSFAVLFKSYTFADGIPFGIKE